MITIQEALRELNKHSTKLNEEVKLPSPWDYYYEITDTTDTDFYNEILKDSDKACNNGYSTLEHIAFVEVKPEFRTSEPTDVDFGELVKDTNDGKIKLARLYGTYMVHCITYTIDDVLNELNIN